MGNSDDINIIIAGDFIPPRTKTNIYSEGLLSALKNKDFSIVNLEAPLTDTGQAIQKNGNNFKASPDSIHHIKEGYFDAVALSNNHMRDFGDEGVTDTLNICRENKINTVGAGRNLVEAVRPLRITIKGAKVSFLNYSEREFNIASKNRAGANPFDIINAYYDIQKEKQECDYIIVIYHGGLEYQFFPTPEMVKNFKFMIDAGADSVVAHHAHRYSGTLVYKDKPLIFGLGNFLCPTIIKITEDWLTGLMLKIKLNDRSIDFELIPVRMSNNFKNVDLPGANDVKNILKQIDEISTLINNELLYIDYWENMDQLGKDRIMRLLKSSSRLEYRLRKYIPVIFNNKVSVYKRNNWLNTTRCDSHRNRLIRILENQKI